MEGVSVGSQQLCTVAVSEGGGKPRAPCSGSGGGATGGLGVGADFDWGFPLTGISSGLASSFSSLSSSSTSLCSLAETPPNSQLTALVEGVMGVMTSKSPA